MKKSSDDVDPNLQNITNFAQQNLLRDVARKLVEELDLSLLMQAILDGAKKLIPFTSGAIGLVDGGMIEFPYAVGESCEDVMEFKIPIGVGPTGWAVKERESVRVGNVTKDPRYKAQIGTTKSELDMPIIYAGESIGVINIESNQENAFSEEDEYLLSTLAEYAAIAIRNAKLFAEMAALREIDQRLTSTLDTTTVLELILETVSDLIKCSEVSVGIVDVRTNNIHFTTARGNFRAYVLDYVGNVEIGLTGLAVREKNPVRVGDVTKDPRYMAQIAETRSEMDVPILFGEEVIGVLNAESPQLNTFTQHDEDLLVALASQAALALRNSQSYLVAETMAAIGDVAGSIVHRMNNDVGAIRVRAQQIRRILTNNPNLDKTETIDGLIKKAQTIDELANKILNDVRFYREQFKETEPGWVNINEIILAFLRKLQIPPEIKVSVELDNSLEMVWGTDVHLTEVFRNLVANAIQAMPKGGELWITSRNEGDKITVRVKDTGIGISDKIRPRIFTRGFTTKEERQGGVGYGLWWVKTYLSRNKGEIKIEETELGIGSTFVVTLYKGGR